MKDKRSRKTLVPEQSQLGSEVAERFVSAGYGLILIPTLSRSSSSTGDHVLGVMADEIQELVKDGQQVVLLEGNGIRWVAQLDRKLARRGVSVEKFRLGSKGPSFPAIP